MAWTATAEAQVCRLSVAGLNRNRRVMGPVSAECPGGLHSAPFGNWGVTSNYGQKRNSSQFEGWCRNIRVCDNAGNCRTECTDGWYEWNSCTTHALFQPPNCTLYNDKECTEQKTVTDVNVHGTVSVDVPVSCPRDTNGDGAFDTGGCRDLTSYNHGANFMSLYELDPLTGDELVQTIYFPQTLVALNCSILSCPPSGSAWVGPLSYDSPAGAARVFAEMATAVGSGVFLDPSQACRAVTPPLPVVSSASYAAAPVAPESLATAFGSRLAAGAASAAGQPLPLELGGVSVWVSDRNGKRQQAGLLYVSPTQVNFVVPPGLATGDAGVSVEDSIGARAAGSVWLERVAPALFSASGDGRGAPAALVVRVDSAGRQTVAEAFRCAAGAASCEPAPIDMGAPTDRVYLILFGTGIRARGSLSDVKLKVRNSDATVLYAGAQAEFAGLDQVNALIPRDLAGRGRVDLVLSVEGKSANPLVVEFR